jgi:crotonobetainyl-CoA:carnitine CoA-transferase CaiB-like acyl-CoA transferase
MGDCWSGIMGANGLLMALIAARRSGRGQEVDLALYETLLRTQGSMVLRYSRDGEVPQRSGNIPPGVVPGNVFTTRDGGFVGLSGAGDKPFQRLCEAIEAPEAALDPRFATGAERRKHRDEANALVADWIGRHTLAEVEARFMEMSVAGAAVRSADEIVGDPHVEARGALVDLVSTSGVPFRAPSVVPKLSRTPARPPRRAPLLGEHTAAVGDLIAGLRARPRGDEGARSSRPMAGALDGVRVVDISQVLNGPWAVSILADHGAEVVLVELPEPGPPVSRAARGDGGFLVTNRNKASVSLDIRRPDGRQALLDLVRVSDVLVENFRPGTLERWGLAPARLLAINPGLVIVRSSGFGQDGPYAGRASFNPVATAFGGVTYLGGSPDRLPLRDGITAGDYSPALFNVMGALAGLIRRDLDGRGQVVDVAMVEATLRMTGDTIALKTALGIRQERAGGAWPVYPYSLTFPAADGRHVALSAQSPAELGAIAAALGLADGETPDQVTAALGAFVGARSAADAVEALRRAGACCSAVNSVADLFREDHVWSRGNLVRDEDPELGSVVTVGVVPTLSRTPGRLAGWSRFRGSENENVLTGLLGYPPDRVSVLTEAVSTSGVR